MIANLHGVKIQIVQHDKVLFEHDLTHITWQFAETMGINWLLVPVTKPTLTSLQLDTIDGCLTALEQAFATNGKGNVVVTEQDETDDMKGYVRFMKYARGFVKAFRDHPDAVVRYSR